MKIYIRAVAGLAIGAVLLWLSLRNIDLDQTRSALAKARITPLALSLGACWFALAIRVVRWRLLLMGIRLFSFGQVGRALLVGYAANNILPARIGELYRVDFVRRQYGAARSAVLGTVIVERLEDAVAALALLSFGLLTAVTKTDEFSSRCCLRSGGWHNCDRDRRRPLWLPIRSSPRRVVPMAKG